MWYFYVILAVVSAAVIFFALTPQRLPGWQTPNLLALLAIAIICVAAVIYGARGGITFAEHPDLSAGYAAATMLVSGGLAWFIQGRREAAEMRRRYQTTWSPEP